MAITAAKQQGKYVGICGQDPSDHHDLAQWLMKEGNDSLSFNPNTVMKTCLSLAENNYYWLILLIKFILQTESEHKKRLS